MTFKQKMKVAALLVIVLLGFSLLGIVVFGDEQTINAVKQLPFLDILKLLGGLLVLA